MSRFAGTTGQVGRKGGDGRSRGSSLVDFLGEKISAFGDNGEVAGDKDSEGETADILGEDTSAFEDRGDRHRFLLPTRHVEDEMASTLEF